MSVTAPGLSSAISSKLRQFIRALINIRVQAKRHLATYNLHSSVTPVATGTPS